MHRHTVVYAAISTAGERRTPQVGRPELLLHLFSCKGYASCLRLPWQGKNRSKYLPAPTGRFYVFPEGRYIQL